MKGFLQLLVFIFFCTLQAQASEVIESFSSRDTLESATAVWNQALGKIHPQLQIVNYKFPAASTPKIFSVGDGSHGAFNSTTYANFSVNGDLSGNKIRLDTTRFPILQVTSFHLEPGWVLEPSGNAPLIIYSLSTVKIEGEIWCQGRAGGDASGATPGAGGIGRCGGKNGGDGGAVGQNGADGTNASASVTAGQGGHATGATAVGGGGGGSWNGLPATLANEGVNSTAGANGGAAGGSVSDPEFTTIEGGAGGGGGSGTTTEAGAGGGAGGGSVIIHSVGDVEIGTSPASATGYIYAQGGKGGDSSATASPGGGGGGGSVQIFSGGMINIFNTDGIGASRAERGAPGKVNNIASSANGSDGRSWLASVGYNSSGTGTYNPSEEAPVVANNNTVEFTNATQSVITKSFDLSSTLATVDSMTLSPTSTDFSVEFRGSNDDFLTDDTGWTTDLSLLANKRFVKMKATVTTSTPANPTMLDEIKFNYTPGQRKDFQFKTSGCATIGPTDSNGPWTFLLLLLPLAFAFLVRSRRFLKSN